MQMWTDRRLGSPLHPQGTLTAVLVKPLKPRITPASAGNTCNFPDGCINGRDHPCIRREHISIETVIKEKPGSPLHPQGTRSSPLKTNAKPRITPASAGNTLIGGKLIVIT